VQAKPPCRAPTLHCAALLVCCSFSGGAPRGAMEKVWGAQVSWQSEKPVASTATHVAASGMVHTEVATTQLSGVHLLMWSSPRLCPWVLATCSSAAVVAAAQNRMGRAHPILQQTSFWGLPGNAAFLVNHTHK
jgi:hypothetical protein